MPSYFERLVEEKGLELAKEHMRSIRQNRVVNIGGGFRSKKTQKKAAASRKQNASNNSRPATES